MATAGLEAGFASVLGLESAVGKALRLANALALFVVGPVGQGRAEVGQKQHRQRQPHPGGDVGLQVKAVHGGGLAGVAYFVTPFGRSALAKKHGL